MPRAFLRDVVHRPYPLPARPWVLGMRWHDLAFLHWPVPAAALQSLLPSGLTIDTFGGTAWLGVVPFRMTGVLPRFVPWLPHLSAFPEINVRTYVTAEGKPGVWFFSLDAPRWLSARAARVSYGLPYFDARMNCREADGWIEYASRRTHRGAPPAEFVGRYRPTGDAYVSRPGELDHWLTERYCLYCADRCGRPHRADIHHQPWPLQAAAAEIEMNTMAAGLGLTLSDTPPVAHFARFIDTVAWWRHAVAAEAEAAVTPCPAGA